MSCLKMLLHTNITFSSLEALNYRTMYQLILSVSQSHYPQIAPTMCVMCKKRSIVYNVQPSFAAAIQVRYNDLKGMEQQGKCIPHKLE